MTTETITEKPILFNGEMVRAILDGRKTQTRRIIKFRDDGPVTEMTRYDEPFSNSPKGELFWGAEHQQDGQTCSEQNIYCPYGRPGGRLWVRETWQPATIGGKPPLYRASINPTNDRFCKPWKPSIHMPRWASRITLNVKDVRVERIQDISDKDAVLEGINRDLLTYTAGDPDCAYEYDGTATKLFRDLWDSINDKRGFGWDVNPWVWVIDFEIADGKGA